MGYLVLSSGPLPRLLTLLPKGKKMALPQGSLVLHRLIWRKIKKKRSSCLKLEGTGLYYLVSHFIKAIFMWFPFSKNGLN